LEQAFGPLRADESYVSVDYEAATDLLEGEASEWAVDCLCEALGAKPYSILWQVLRSGLTDHLIAVRSGGKMEWKRQTNGQLMGSSVSFMILCLVNYSVIRAAVRLTPRGEMPDDAPLTRYRTKILVNGDDAAFKGTLERKRAWERCSLCAGLKKSVGKNYVSREFILLNSRAFLPTHVDWPDAMESTNQWSFNFQECHVGAWLRGGDDFPDLWTFAGVEDDWVTSRTFDMGLSTHNEWLGFTWRSRAAWHPSKIRWTPVPFFNLAVLRPPRLVSDWEFLDQAANWHSALLLGTNPQQARRWTTLFLSVWQESLRKLPPWVNWFVDRGLGGLGMSRWGMASDCHLSDLARIVAAYCRRCTNPIQAKLNCVSLNRVAPDTDLHDLTLSMLAPLIEKGSVKLGIPTDAAKAGWTEIHPDQLSHWSYYAGHPNRLDEANMIGGLLDLLDPGRQHRRVLRQYSALRKRAQTAGTPYTEVRWSTLQRWSETAPKLYCEGNVTLAPAPCVDLLASSGGDCLLAPLALPRHWSSLMRPDAVAVDVLRCGPLSPTSWQWGSIWLETDCKLLGLPGFQC